MFLVTFVHADEANTIHLKCNIATSTSPCSVLDHQVPVFICNNDALSSSVWDITTQQVTNFDNLAHSNTLNESLTVVCQKLEWPTCSVILRKLCKNCTWISLAVSDPTVSNTSLVEKQSVFYTALVTKLLTCSDLPVKWCFHLSLWRKWLAVCRSMVIGNVI